MKTSNYRASFYTLGCRLNQAETALISDSFKSRGFEIAEFGDPTDVCIINTCTVTEQADAKCRQLIRQVLKRSPDACVAVVGCYAQVGTDALRDIEGIDLIVGTQEKMRIAEMIDIPQKLPEPVVHTPRIGREPFTISSVGNYAHATRANLKIQDGCDFMCTFCVIPFARGRARSRVFRDIQREAIELVARGHKEIVLSGVNIGTYSYEQKDILDVVCMLESIAGLERIRISSIEPTTIPYTLIEHMAESDKLCNHFHIPLQSGDDNILRSMRRMYTVAEYKAFIEKIAQRIPDVCFGTDVMIGFPGEGKQAFQNTVNVLTELPFSYFHVFNFSERGGTPAAGMTDKVAHAIRKQRSATLRDLSMRKRTVYNKKQLGKRMQILFEEKDDNGNWTGFTDNYVRVMVKSRMDLENEISQVQLVAVDNMNVVTGNLVND